MTLVTVRVQSRAKTPGVERTGERAFKVRVRSIPEKGRANREVITRLADFLDIPPSQLKIVKGRATSSKTIQIV